MEEWSLATKSPRAPLFSKVPDLWCTPLMESAQRRRPGGPCGRPNASGCWVPSAMRVSILSLDAEPSTFRSATPVPHTEYLRRSRTCVLPWGDPVRSWVSLRRANRSRLWSRTASVSSGGRLNAPEPHARARAEASEVVATISAACAS